VYSYGVKLTLFWSGVFRDAADDFGGGRFLGMIMLYSIYNYSIRSLHTFAENCCYTLAELIWILLVFPTGLHLGHFALEEAQ